MLRVPHRGLRGPQWGLGDPQKESGGLPRELGGCWRELGGPRRSSEGFERSWELAGYPQEWDKDRVRNLAIKICFLLHTDQFVRIIEAIKSFLSWLTRLHLSSRGK